MAQADKVRWNKRHQDRQVANIPIKLISEYTKLAFGKQALDIACGMGRHSRYLATQGFKVDALDISDIAISSLKSEANINAMIVDFDTYTLKKNKYDLIVCTYFLERKLFPLMIEALKPNGVILYETFLKNEKNEKKPSNPAFLLEKGELKSYFSKACEIVFYSEWDDVDSKGNKMVKASMVAKKN